MRSSTLLFPLTLLAASTAHAEPATPPALAMNASDAELLGYIAEAEAQAEAGTGETIYVEEASPVDTPSSGVRAVSARALELTPHKNADDLLRVVPGLYTSQHGSEGKGQQFFLRGFDAVHGSDLSIRVGGIPLNELSNVHGQGYADLGFLIPETLSGVTSRKGPFDLEQGWFATAGAIDLELGVATRGKRVGYELGTTNRHRLVAIDAPAGGPSAQFVAAEIMHDDGYGRDRGTERGSAIAQTELRAGRLVLRPMIAGYWARFGEPGVVALDDIRSAYFDRMDAPAGDLGGKSRRLLAGLGTAWARGGDEVVASAHLGWRGLALDENFTGFLESELGDGRRQTHSAITGGARIAWRRQLAPWLRMLAGTELIHDELAQAEDRVSTTGEVWREERSLEAATSSAGVWAGLAARRGRLVATGGVRVDAMMVDATDRLAMERSGSGAVAAVSPRLALAWRDERFSLSLAVGRGQRPPEARAFTQRPSREDMDAVVYDGGAPAITTADSVELGGELRAGKLSAGATGFATRIDSESIFDHLSGVNALLDGSRRVGVEAFVEASPLPYLALRGDVTAVDARFEVTGNPVPGAPTLLGSVEVRYDRKPWAAGLAGRFLGPRPLLHGASAAAGAVFDATGSWTRGRWTLQLQIDNLLGTDWNEGEYNFASYWDPSAPKSSLPRVHISPGRPFGARLGATVQF